MTRLERCHCGHPSVKHGSLGCLGTRAMRDETIRVCQCLGYRPRSGSNRYDNPLVRARWESANVWAALQRQQAPVTNTGEQA